MFLIRTVYVKEDIEGLYRAFIAGKKLIRTSKTAVRIITTVLAILFWLFATFIIIANLTTGDIRAVLRGLPIALIFIGLGFFIFFRGRAGFDSKTSWKMYPYKGKQLTYCFSDNEFILEQTNSTTRVSYDAIIRIYEDSERYYLFDSPQTAHILPKRDFEQNRVPEFGDFISSVTGMPIEHF